MAQKQSYFVPRKSVVVDGSAETHLFTFFKTEKILFFKKIQFLVEIEQYKILIFHIRTASM